MSQRRRKSPAIFERALGEWQPKPQYTPFPEFQPPPLPANPIIGFRYGQWLGDAVTPLIGTGPRFERFPYFQEPPAPANPVIGYRYGQDVLARLRAFVSGKHHPFPYRQEPPAEPATPIIPVLRAQWLADQIQPLVGSGPRYLPFPYFEQPLPANAVIAFRYGQNVLARLEAFVAARYSAFPYFQPPANPVIQFRSGQVVLLAPAAFIMPRYTAVGPAVEGLPLGRPLFGVTIVEPNTQTVGVVSRPSTATLGGPTTVELT